MNKELSIKDLENLSGIKAHTIRNLGEALQYFRSEKNQYQHSVL